MCGVNSWDPNWGHRYTESGSPIISFLFKIKYIAKYLYFMGIHTEQ